MKLLVIPVLVLTALLLSPSSHGQSAMGVVTTASGDSIHIADEVYWDTTVLTFKDMEGKKRKFLYIELNDMRIGNRYFKVYPWFKKNGTPDKKLAHLYEILAFKGDKILVRTGAIHLYIIDQEGHKSELYQEVLVRPAKYNTGHNITDKNHERVILFVKKNFSCTELTTRMKENINQKNDLFAGIEQLQCD